MNREWMKDAGCLGLAGMFEDKAQYPDALHICWFHCPVRARCAAWTAEGNEPMGMVQGGRAWQAFPKEYGKAPAPMVQVKPARTCGRCRMAALAELINN